MIKNQCSQRTLVHYHNATLVLLQEHPYCSLHHPSPPHPPRPPLLPLQLLLLPASYALPHLAADKESGGLQLESVSITSTGNTHIVGDTQREGGKEKIGGPPFSSPSLDLWSAPMSPLRISLHIPHHHRSRCCQRWCLISPRNAKREEGVRDSQDKRIRL